MMLIDATALTLQRPAALPLAFAPRRASRPENAYLLLGPSGCGKTTLLSLLAGLLPPTSRHGHVRGTGSLRPARSPARCACAASGSALSFRRCTCCRRSPCGRISRLAGDMAGGADAARVDSLLRALGLAAKAHRRPEALSQGEQQRAAIARAVLNRPAVIIADEPTSALDDDNARIVIDLLTRTGGGKQCRAARRHP